MKTRSLQPPKLPKPLRAETVSSLDDHAEYSQVAWSGGDFTNQSASGVIFDQVHLRRVILSGSKLPKVRLVDVQLEASDLSGAEWEKAHWRRVEFIGCKLLGAQFLEMRGEDVLFRDCNLEDAVFTSATFKLARFEKCVLRGASFESADLSGVVFLECDLGNVDLLGSQLVGADFRGSMINGLRAGAKELKGAIIDPTQAEQIVGLLGITVKEPD